MFPQVIQRVPVLREDEELAAAVLQFVELRPRQAFAQGDQLGIAPAVADAADPRRHVAERGDFGPELVQFDCRRRTVDQLVAGVLIQIALVLLRVGEPAGELRKPFRALGRRKSFQFLDEVRQLGPAAEQ